MEETTQVTMNELLGIPREAEPHEQVDVLRIEHIPLDRIDPFPEHPYQVRDDEEMARLTESVREQGVLSPAIVRRKDDGRFELVSGHRRKRASELAELSSLPAIVSELNGEQAAVLLVDSNCQREHILPSEKAHAYKMKLEALRKQGKRTDLTSRPVVAKSQSAEVIGADSGESGRQVQRYIRLTELIPPLLSMVDEGRIAFRPAVELSYLPKKSQRELLAAIEREVCTPSLAQAFKMKAFSQEGKLTSEVIASIMQEQKSNQKEQLRIPRESIAKFFKKDDNPQTITETIIKALELYRKRERSREAVR